MLLACCLLFGLALAQEKGIEITGFAVPSGVKVGDNVELQCNIALLQPQDGAFMVKWWLKPLNKTRNDVLLYQTLKSDSAWKGNNTIKIVDIQANYSGTYRCVANNYNEETREQELIVYTPGTGPNLTITEVQSDTGDKYIQLTCSAEGVAPEPELDIFVGVEKQQSNETSVQDSKTSLWDITMNATVQSIEEDTVVSCELTYKDAKIPHEQYIDRITYMSSGGAPNSNETAETTIAIATAPQNGNGIQGLFSWLIMMASCLLLLL